MSETIDARAEAYARKAHEGQFRKDGVTPYFSHCLEVADEAYFLANDEKSKESLLEVRAAGFLHDVVEDCPGYELSHIYKEFGDRVGFLVEAMTEDYAFKPRAIRSLRYNYQILQAARKDPDVFALKYADMWANVKWGFAALKPSFRAQFAAEILRSLDFFDVHDPGILRNQEIHMFGDRIRKKAEEELDWLIRGVVSDQP